MRIPNRPIVTPHIAINGSGGRPKLLVIGLVVLLVWTWAAYQFGRDGFGLDVVEPPERVVDSDRKLEQLTQKYEALKDRAAEIGKTGQVMTDAQKMAMDEINRLQDERMSLIKQVSALTESAAANKLRLDIKEIEITPGAEPGIFDYRVAVDPLLGVYGTAHGMIKLEVSGESDGKAVVVTMSEDDGIQEDNRRVFGLLQELRGTLEFPEQFTPDKISLELVTGDEVSKPQAQSYKWAEILKEKPVLDEGLDQKDQLIDDLRRKNLAMTIKMAKKEREEQARLAENTGDKLAKLQQERDVMAREITQLKQQVADLQGRIKIKSISLKPRESEGTVEINVTVTRTIIDGQRLQGALTISLSGTENEQPKVYPLEELTEDQKTNYKLGFKNFQEIKEPLKMPAGFTPQKILIHAESENLELDALDEEFDWPELTADGKKKKS